MPGKEAVEIAVDMSAPVAEMPRRAGQATTANAVRSEKLIVWRARAYSRLTSRKALRGQGLWMSSPRAKRGLPARHVAMCRAKPQLDLAVSGREQQLDGLGRRKASRMRRRADSVRIGLFWRLGSVDARAARFCALWAKAVAGVDRGPVRGVESGRSAPRIGERSLVSWRPSSTRAQIDDIALGGEPRSSSETSV